MEEIQKYINLTRGCTQPIEDEEQTCLHSIFDSMHTFDWAENIKSDNQHQNLVEVRFKNGRKGIYQNTEELFLRKGDIVAVEAMSGHDIGIIDLQGESVYWQIKKHEQLPKNQNYPRIYRKARPLDIEKWNIALKKEPTVLQRSKEIISDINLKMKLGSIEFQGDGSKATFYYTADERVDFRELIKILASEFKIRIEMRQIGARQESSKIGGIGTCGRELCCISWKRNFTSVTTNSARHQDLSLNPTKLAGQCGKLKCCLNYELDCYIEARKNFPNTSIPLKTKEGNAYFQKSDVFKGILWYSSDPENSVNITPLPIKRVEEILEMNKKREFPDTLLQDNLHLADLISSKHNIKITSDEVEESKKYTKKLQKKKPYKKRRPYKNRNQKNSKQNNNSRNNNTKNKNNK